MPQPRAIVHALVILFLLVLVGCQTASAKKTRSGHRPARGQTQPASHQPPANLNTPPGVKPDQLAALHGQALERARLDQARIAEALPTPDYLEKGIKKGINQAAAKDGQTTEPPLAAQRDYAHARVIWQEGRDFQAIQKLQQARQRAPQSPAILRLLGLIYTTSQNKVRGANYLEDALARDPEDLRSIYLLGRFELTQQNWERAAALLIHGLKVEADQAEALRDPATRPLMQYYLGVALDQAGYARQAVNQYQAYLDSPRQLTRATAHAKELLFIDQSQATIWRSVGDSHLRLDKPAKALADYNHAAEALDSANSGEPINVPGASASPTATKAKAGASASQQALAKRRVYANLRMGRFDLARKIVAEQVRTDQADPTTLALVRYLLQYTSPGQLADQLRQIYVDRDRPSALALTLAGLLPPNQAQPLLQSHLRHKPGDIEVFERLLKIPPASGNGLAQQKADHPSDQPQPRRDQAVSRTIAQISNSFDHAQAYAQALARTLGSYEVVLSSLKEVPESIRNQAAGQVLRGLALQQTDQHEAAAKALAQALDLNPDLPSVRMQQARLLMDQHHYDEAAALLDGIDVDGDNPEMVRLRVRVLLEDDRPEQALDVLNQALSDQKNDASTLSSDARADLVVVKSKIQRKMDHTDKAEQTLIDALNASPRQEAYYAALLELYRSAPGEYREQMRGLIQRMLSTIPQSRIARLTRARLRFAGGDFDRAEALLSQLLAEKPEDMSALRMLVELYQRTDRREQAVALLENLLLKMPDNFQRTRDLALLYRNTNQPDKAIDLIKKRLQQDQVQDPGALVSLLWRLMLDQDPPNGEQAKRLVAKARDRFPNHAGDLGYEYATLLSRLGEEKRSEQVMEQTLKKAPDHAGTNNALAYLWATQNKNLDRARRMIDKALDQDPDNSAYLDSKGWVLYKMGRFKDAAHWLRKSKDARAGDYPVILDHLGDALYRFGRKAEATTAWKRASKMLSKGDYPKDPEIEGLGSTLKKKIDAAKQRMPVPVAQVPEENQ